MKVNDLVLPKKEYSSSHINYGVGIIIEKQKYENDDVVYCLVQWAHEDQWWNVNELIKVKEKDEKNNT